MIEEITKICDIIAHHHSPGKINTLKCFMTPIGWLISFQISTNDQNFNDQNSSWCDRGFEIWSFGDWNLFGIWNL
jgi:hypothetical protein